MLRLSFFRAREHIGAQQVLVVAPVGDRSRGHHHKDVLRAVMGCRRKRSTGGASA